MEKRVLCTGGCGFIGAHTVVHLVEKGYEVSILDNLSNSSEKILGRLEEIVGKPIPFFHVDLCDTAKLAEIFQKNKFDAVIHYAALKAVGESVSMPLKYFQNNLNGLLNLLEVMTTANCKKIVYSSSATVYLPSEEKLTEEFPIGACNPYGQSKVMGEQILRDLFVADPQWKISILRYFNPIGAHHSGKIGEGPVYPTNLLPVIQQVIQGKRKHLEVFGDDYNTVDGTGVRDYLHVEDLANGHIQALAKLHLMTEGAVLTHNLGTGRGTSVFEMVKTFEEAAGVKVPFVVAPRRAGDVGSCVADPTKANKELKWEANRTNLVACQNAWKWLQMNPNGFND
eukprot:Platyproteum_vivax@DN979_c0_g1_i1.p1